MPICINSLLAFETKEEDESDESKVAINAMLLSITSIPSKPPTVGG